MILYDPIHNDVKTTPIKWRVKSCFLMRQLKEESSSDLKLAIQKIRELCLDEGFTVIDAEDLTTGRDFLLKIWEIIISVPVGIAVVHKEISPQTMANIFYELGLMQALGKEILIIEIGSVSLPSDFTRTEYVAYNNKFEERIKKFFTNIQERANYYELLAGQVENNPLLAIDYLRRAYLLSGNGELKQKAKRIRKEISFSDRAKNSVEMLLTSFTK